MMSRLAGNPSRSVVTSKDGSRGKSRQAKRRNPTSSATRRVFHPKRRASRAEAPPFSRLRDSKTFSGSAPISSPGAVRIPVLLERTDDLPHQVVAHDVALVQIDEREILHALQDRLNLDEPGGMLGAEVDLGHVPRDDGLRAVAE